MNGFLFILILAAIYLIGAIPTGIVLARIMGYQDVRGHGSGNIGATNVYRVAGKLPGLLTLLGDILKGWLPLMIYQVWLAPTPAQLGFASVAAIVGHCYPIYLKFKGGKGVATALGIFLVLSPQAVLGAALIFAFTVATTRFISLGSILAALSAPLWILLLDAPEPILLATFFIAALIVWRHRSNIRRLLDGREDRFKARGKSES